MISPPFELLSLPNVSVDKLARTPVSVDGLNFHIGVSQSSVTTVSLRPSRVVGAFSVPPSVDITAVATDGNQTTPIVVYATNERKKHFLKVIDSQISQQIKKEVAQLHFANGCFVAIQADNTMEAFSAETLESKWNRSAKKGLSYKFSAMIEDGVCVVISEGKKRFVVETLAFDQAGVRELKSVEIALEGPIGKFSYSEGTIYRCQDRTIQLYNVPDANLISQFDIQGNESIQDMVALSNNNICVIQNSILSVIDCSYRSTISKCELPSGTPINLLAYSPGAETIIASSAKTVLGLSVSPSSGTLLESIGHGVAAANPQFTCGHCDLLPSLTAKNNFVPTLLQNIKEAQESSSKILHALEAATKKKDEKVFSKTISYLKGDSWEQAQPSSETVVYEDTDRQVDRDLIKQITYLVFKVESGSTSLSYLPFLPNSFAIYLLTHPLFPTGEPEMKDLFTELKAHPQLYRQAIVTLSSASPEDILGGLLSQDEDIFRDAALRLEEEFGQQQITLAIQSLFNRSSGSEELIQVVDRLSKTADGWALIAPFVDSLGLLAWDKTSLDKLRERLQAQLEGIQSAVTTNRLISELFMSVEIDAEDGKTISNGEIKRRSKKSQETDKTRDEPKFVPKYSVETLVIN